jgi:hypothetical protein
MGSTTTIGETCSKVVGTYTVTTFVAVWHALSESALAINNPLIATDFHTNGDVLSMTDWHCSDARSTREPWSTGGAQVISLLESADSREFLDTLPRTVKLSGRALGFSVDDSMVVTAVETHSAAAAAGVRVGMFLLRFGNAPVGAIRSFEELQMTVSMTPPPWLFRFSAGVGLSFDSSPMVAQVFECCDKMHQQRLQSHITQSAMDVVEAAAQQASASTAQGQVEGVDDGAGAHRPRAGWQRAAQQLVHTRSAPPSLKALARGDRNSIAILSMHYRRLRDERRDSLPATPRRRGHQKELVQQRTEDEHEEHERLVSAVNKAFDGLPPEVDRQAADQACCSIGITSMDSYLDGLWGAYDGAERLPRETIKRCVIKRCLGP